MEGEQEFDLKKKNYIILKPTFSLQKNVVLQFTSPSPKRERERERVSKSESE